MFFFVSVKIREVLQRSKVHQFSTSAQLVLPKTNPKIQEEALWQKSLDVLDTFPTINVEAVDAAIVACGRAGRWRHCLQLLTQRWTVDNSLMTWSEGKGQPKGSSQLWCSQFEFFFSPDMLDVDGGSVI